MPPDEQEWFAHLAFGAVLARRLNDAADIYRFLLRFAPHNTAWLMGLCYCLVNAPTPSGFEEAASRLKELEAHQLNTQTQAAHARLVRRLELRQQSEPAADASAAAAA